MGKTALVLAGGGSRGSYELGVWQALREMDITINLVTGTSIGAINGSLIAQGSYETATALWDKIQTSHIFDVQVDEKISLRAKVLQTYRTFARDFIKSGGTNTNSLKKTLSSFFDEDKIRASPIDYGLVTIEMDTRKPHELFKADIPPGKIIDYILASASIYPAVKPYIIDGVRYVDGAYYDNLPVRMALEKGATEIIAVDLEAFGVVKKEELRLARKVTYIRCYWDLGPTLVFDHDIMRRNTRLGYLDTLKAYSAYDGYAFTYIKGFCEQVDKLFTERLPVTGWLSGKMKTDGASMIDKMFWGRIHKFFEDRDISQPQSRDVGLVCAEVAGEIFGLNSEIIYSFEVWQRKLGIQTAMADLPDGLVQDATESKRGMLSALRGTATLRNKRTRAKYAGTVISEMIRSQNFQTPIADLAIMPDALLAGAYLAATGLI